MVNTVSWLRAKSFTRVFHYPAYRITSIAPSLKLHSTDIIPYSHAYAQKQRPTGNVYHRCNLRSSSSPYIAHLASVRQAAAVAAEYRCGIIQFGVVCRRERSTA